MFSAAKLQACPHYRRKEDDSVDLGSDVIGRDEVQCDGKITQHFPVLHIRS